MNPEIAKWVQQNQIRYTSDFASKISYCCKCNCLIEDRNGWRFNHLQCVLRELNYCFACIEKSM